MGLHKVTKREMRKVLLKARESDAFVGPCAINQHPARRTPSSPVWSFNVSRREEANKPLECVRGAAFVKFAIH